MTNKKRAAALPDEPSNATGADRDQTFSLGLDRVAPALVLIDGENPISFKLLLDALDAEFEARGPMAAFLVDYAATLIWRLRRVATFEAGLLTWISDQQRQRHDSRGLTLGDVFFSGDARSLPVPSQNSESHWRQQRGRQVIGRTLEAALDKSDPLGKIGRYEGHLMRQLARTLEELRRLRWEQRQSNPQINAARGVPISGGDPPGNRS